MQYIKETNNKVMLTGRVKSEPQVFNDIVTKELFYNFVLATKRNSGADDLIKIIVPAAITGEISAGKIIKVEGEIRTKIDQHKTVYVMAQNLGNAETDNVNEVIIEGILCKKSEPRATLTGRIITDLVITTGRNYKKFDYMPAIAWGRNARACANMEIGEKIKVKGRLQSRDYEKQGSDGRKEIITVNEISICDLLRE